LVRRRPMRRLDAHRRGGGHGRRQMRPKARLLCPQSDAIETEGGDAADELGVRMPRSTLLSLHFFKTTTTGL
jgi:hypothetical protein